ncbi:hypothetical protein EJB05_27033, partial [Eragrostis curvula]
MCLTHAKEELCPSTMPSRTAQQPGVSLRSIENLGFDVQQAVISCFNGFSLDVFKDEVMYNCSHLLPTTFIHTDRAQGVAGWLALDAQGDQALVGGAVAAVERQDVVHHRFHGRSAGAGSVEEKTSFGGALQAGVVSEGFGNKSLSLAMDSWVLLRDFGPVLEELR